MYLTVGDRDRLVNGDRPGGAALDCEGLWSPILSRAERGRQRHLCAAVGELEINLGGQRIALAAYLVGLFADGLFELVESELALFDDGRGRLLCEADKGQGCAE